MGNGIQDWRSAGIFPLQDHEAGVPLGRRWSMAGARVLKVPDPEDGEVEQSLVEYGREGGFGSIAPIHPWVLWPTADKDRRAVGAWAQAFAGMVSSASGGTTGGGDASGVVQPVRDWLWHSDLRFAPKRAILPSGLPRLPVGSLGIAMGAMEEDEQHDLVLHADPRLIAPAAAGPGDTGTLVCDLGPANTICMAGSTVPGLGGRHARLQSLVRVIAFDPGGSGNVIPTPGNCIALNFGTSQQDGLPGFGMIFTRGIGGGGPITSGGSSGPTSEASAASNLDDAGNYKGKRPHEVGKFDPSPSSSYVVAFLEQTGASGPIIGGHVNDKHRLGHDRDGHAMVSAHISSRALIYDDVTRDGPYHFEGDYPKPPPLPLQSRVHLTWDGDETHEFVGGAAAGKWKWWAEVPIVVPRTGSPPYAITPGGGPGPGGPTTGQPRGPSGPVPPGPGGGGGNPITPNPANPSAPGGSRFPGYPITGGPGGPTGPNPSPRGGMPAGQTGGGGTPTSPPGPPAPPPKEYGPGGAPITPGPAYPEPFPFGPAYDPLRDGPRPDPSPRPDPGPGRPDVGPWRPDYDPNGDQRRTRPPFAWPIRKTEHSPGAVHHVGQVQHNDRTLHVIHHPFAESFASAAWRPQLWVLGVPNLERGGVDMEADYIHEREWYTPQTIVARSWGGQDENLSDWSYVQNPGDSRARGGIVDGGVLWSPPEFEMEDYLGIVGDQDVWDPSSTAHIALAPGAVLAFGVPHLDGGMSAEAVVIRQDTTTNARWWTVEQLNASRSSIMLLRTELDQATDEVLVRFGGQQAVVLPSGADADRPTSAAAGMLRHSTQGGVEAIEFYDDGGGTWRRLLSSGSVAASDVTLDDSGWSGSLAGEGIATVQDLADWIDANLLP